MPFNVLTQLLRPDGLHDKPVQAEDNLYDVYGMKEFVNEFARAKYLALTGGLENKTVNDFKNQEDPSYISNYIKNPNEYIDFSSKSKNLKEMNGVFLVLRGDSVTVSADASSLNEIGREFEWVNGDADLLSGTVKDTSIVISFGEAKEYKISLTQDGTSYNETKKFKVFDNKKKAMNT